MADLGNVLIVIPARGGSKRLPRKNVLPLGGKPLICWTIESALQTGVDAQIVVSSEDPEILSIAGEYAALGVRAHQRPLEFATDTATTADTIANVVAAEIAEGQSPDTVILLQPTSPLRSATDVLEAVKVYKDGECGDTVVSVCELDHPTAWVGVLGDNATLCGIDLSGRRSQEYRKEYRLNGAVYVASSHTIKNQKTLFTPQLRASIMPKNRSIDIDEELDFIICEAIIDRYPNYYKL